MALATNLKIKIFKLAISFGLAALVTSCASNHEKSERSYQFLTRISASGLKLFEVRELQTESRPKQTDIRKTARNAKKTFQRSLNSLRKASEGLIAENQYCKDDFWVLEADIDFRGPYLRGECNDLASDADRQSFPDSIENW